VRQLVFAFAMLWAGMAQASQITILSIDSKWEVDKVFGNANVTGDGTNLVHWGRNFVSNNGPRSGFQFEQTVLGAGFKSTHDANKLFDVGIFTHMNRVIYQDEHLETAWLHMRVKASFFDGKEHVERTFNTRYKFSLWETPNYDNPCANGEQNNLNRRGRVTGKGSFLNQSGCADRVQLLKNDALVDEFVHNGLKYKFELFGFNSGAEFWTIEDLNNSTELQAKFTVSGGPPISPVPLPAGAWFLIAGLGGLGLMRRLSRR
jgi:hypothetical protein